MKMLIRFAILMGATICAATLAGPDSALAQEIHWQSNPQQAANQAANENKLVMLHFTAAWCGPCQTQKRFVFSNPTVAQAVNQSVIPVLVDVDVNRELAGELGVKSIPFDVFLTPGGEVVSKRSSPTDSQNFIGMVTSLRAPAPAPKTGALAKLAELKRRFDPMSLPRDKRANYGVESPEVASVGVSKEAMGLAAKSNYGNQMTFQNQGNANAKGGDSSNMQSVVNALARRKIMKGQEPKAEDQFFDIAANRPKHTGAASTPVASQMVSNPSSPQANQRGYENLERQAFLDRERAQIEIPRH